jgi:hypothetical protein
MMTTKIIDHDKHWDMARQRQSDLARLIGERYLNGAPLISPTPDFSWPPSSLMESVEMIYDKSVEELGWWMVAQQIQEAIDHAWLLKMNKRPWYELVGFVTEPYLSAEEAAKVVKRLLAIRPLKWFIKVHVLPTELSAWNPGRTVPIVVLMAANVDMKEFAQWALISTAKALDWDQQLSNDWD